MKEELGKEETDDSFDVCEHCGEEWDLCLQAGLWSCGSCFCDDDSEVE
jgi:hypothetical protein